MTNNTWTKGDIKMTFPSHFFFILLLASANPIKAAGNQFDCPGTGWTSNGRYCYNFYLAAVRFTVAEAACNQDGAYLPSIHSSEEDLFILNMVQSSPQSDNYYIGLQNVIKSAPDSGDWTDGTARDYNNWRSKSNEPNSGGCTVLHEGKESQWKDSGCNAEQSYVCKYDTGCGGSFTGSVSGSQLLPMPGAGVMYHDNAHCTWYFEAHQTGSCLRFDVSSLDIVCDVDYVQIYNGQQSDSPALTDKLCGTTAPGNVYSTGMFATLVFVTDGSGTAAGFDLTYYSRDCGSTGEDVCNTLSATDSTSGVLTSHSLFGSAEYPARSECLWHIDGSAYGTIALDFVTFDVQDHSGCIYDFLEIRQGTDETGVLVGRYCGSVLPTRLLLPGPSLWIQLVTDDTSQANGFQLNYMFYGCGDTLTTSGGTVTSDNYPTAYTEDQSCAWQIEAPFGNQIQITFSSMFEIDCASGDYIEVFDGQFSSSKSLGQFCGDTAPIDVKSSLNQLLTIFYSDATPASSGAGFEFTYTFVTGNVPCRTTIDVESVTVWFPFDTLTDGVFSDGTYSMMTSNGTATLVPGILGNAVYLDGTTVLTLGERQQNCFFSPDECADGATLAMWMQYKPSLAGELEMFQLLSSGGQTGDSYGWSIFLDPASDGAGLMIDVSTTTKSATLVDLSWSTRSTDIVDQWVHLAISFDSTGIYLYQDGDFVQYSAFQLRQSALVDSAFNAFVFGIPNNQLDTQYYSGAGYIDDLIFWNSTKDQEFIETLFHTYNTDREICTGFYECLSVLDPCSCPSDSIDCNATVSFSSDTLDSAPIPEDTVVQFTCDIDGVPPFELFLMMADNGTISVTETAPINQSSFTTNLTMTRAQNNVSYFCRTSNPYGNANYHESESSIFYNVEYEARVVTITSDIASESSIVENFETTFTCATDRNPPGLLSLTVGPDAEVIYSEITNTFTVMLSLTRDYNELLFNCTVSNDNGDLVSVDSLQYTVTYEAAIVNITSDVISGSSVVENTESTFTCATDRNPPSRLSLTVGPDAEVVYSEVTNTFTVTRSLTRDYNELIFNCTVSNDNADLVSVDSLQYTVTYNASDVTITSSALAGTAVQEGSTVIFTCTTDRNPPGQVLLVNYQTSDVLANETTNILTVELEMMRNYNNITLKCQIPEGNNQNLLVSSGGFQYSVEYDATAVTITSDLASGTEAVENTNVTFTCTTDRNPPGQLSVIVGENAEVVQTEITNTMTGSHPLTRDYNGLLFKCAVSNGNGDVVESEDSFQYNITYDATEVTITSDITTGSSVTENTEVTLSCTTDRNPPGLLSLILDSVSDVVDSEIANSIAITVRLTKDIQGRVFKCAVSNNGDDVISVENFQYDIQYNATEVNITSDIASGTTVVENTNVTFSCTTDRNPPAQLYLIVGSNGDVVTSEISNSFTIIQLLSRDYNGLEFACTVTNDNVDVITSSDSYLYSIEYDASDVAISSTALTGTAIQEGSTVTINCTADQNPPGPISLIKYPSMEVIAMDTANTLTVLLELTRDYNNVQLKCEGVTNQNSTMLSNGLQYTVTYDATNVTITSDIRSGTSVVENTNVTFTCTTDSNPLGQLTLTAGPNDDVVTSEIANSFTVIIPLTRDYNGLDYVCTVSNDNVDLTSAGKYQYTIEYDATEVIITSTAVTGMSLQEGSNVTINCTTDKNPPGEIHLIKYPSLEVISSEITNEFSVSVELTRDENNVQLVCEAVNTNIQNSTVLSNELQYTVEYEATDVTITSDILSGMSVMEYTEVTFTCTTDRNPLGPLSLIVGPNAEVVYSEITNTLTVTQSLTRDYNGLAFNCTVQNTDGSSVNSADSYMFVIEYLPNEVIMISSALTGTTIQEGSTVTFTCITDQTPVGLITLVKYPKLEVIASEMGNNLTVQYELNRECNNILFQCQAYDESLQNLIVSFNEIQYTVEYAAIEVTMTSDLLSGTSVVEHTNVTFTCTTDRNPLGQLSLIVGENADVVYKEMTNTFTISLPLTRDYDRLFFACTIVNDFTDNLISDASYQYVINYGATDVAITSSVPEGTAVEEGSIITFLCITDQNPPGQIYLTKDPSTDIIARETSNRLNVPVTLTRDDNNVVFQCNAIRSNLDNDLVSSDGLQYIVNYDATEVNITSDLPSGTEAMESRNVTFTCTTDRNPPGQLSLVVGENAEVVQTEITNTMMGSHPLTRDYNRLLFKCAVSNGNGDVVESEDSFQYDITYNASNVSISSTAITESLIQESSVVTFTCTTDQNPPGNIALVEYPSLTAVIQDTGNSLSVPLEMTRDYNNVTFKCQASDVNMQNFLMSSDGCRYTIAYGASEVLMTSDTPTQTSQVENTEVTFTCTADRNPPGQLSLVVGPTTEVLHTDITNSLNFTQPLTRDYNGLAFQCSVSDGSEDVILSADSYQYIINFPPSQVNVTISPNSQVTEGTAVTVSCITEDYVSDETVTWQRDGVEIAADQEVYIDGENGARSVRSEVYITADISLNNTVYVCNVTDVSDSVTLFVDETPPSTANVLAMALGVAGGVLGVATVGGAAVAVMIGKSKPLLSTALIKQYPTKVPYIPRGFKAQLPSYPNYQQKLW